MNSHATSTDMDAVRDPVQNTTVQERGPHSSATTNLPMMPVEVTTMYSEVPQNLERPLTADEAAIRNREWVSLDQLLFDFVANVTVSICTGSDKRPLI